MSTTTATGDCGVCGADEVPIHLLATCVRCRAAAGRFQHQEGPRQPAGGKRGRKALQGLSYDETFCCSFCGRSPRETRKLFSGPWVFICDGCVALAVEAIREEDGGDRPRRDDDHHAPSPQGGRKTTLGRAVMAEESQRREITNVGRAPSAPSRRTPR